MNAPIYLGIPLSSVKALTGLLQIPEEALLEVSNDIGEHYKQNKPEIKPNGKERITFRLSSQLKFIQTQIKEKIFHNVQYPIYLQGSIKDENNTRSYDNDARIHAASRLIISEDITNFFPTIGEKHILNMWKYLFGFSPEVSILLTTLTTLEGCVPQGSVSSSYLANLLFWDLEGELIDELKQMDFIYSRYIDDITVSSRRTRVPKQEIEYAIKKYILC